MENQRVNIVNASLKSIVKDFANNRRDYKEMKNLEPRIVKLNRTLCKFYEEDPINRDFFREKISICENWERAINSRLDALKESYNYHNYHNRNLTRFFRYRSKSPVEDIRAEGEPEYEKDEEIE